MIDTCNPDKSGYHSVDVYLIYSRKINLHPQIDLGQNYDSIFFPTRVKEFSNVVNVSWLCTAWYLYWILWKKEAITAFVTLTWRSFWNGEKLVGATWRVLYNFVFQNNVLFFVSFYVSTLFLNAKFIHYEKLVYVNKNFFVEK